MFFLFLRKLKILPLIVGFTALLLAGCSEFVPDAGKDAANIAIPVEEKEIIPQGAIAGNITVDLSSISEGEKMDLHGLTRSEVLDRISSMYDFSLRVINGIPDKSLYDEVSGNGVVLSENRIERLSTVSNDNVGADSFDIPDIIGPGVEVLLNEIYTNHGDKGLNDKDSYSLDIPFEEYADIYSSLLHDAWSVDAVSGAITSYDPENDEFLFGSSRDGYEVDKEKLKEDILDRLINRDFDCEIEATGNPVSAGDGSLKERYETLASYETHTTAQAVRNRNVELAAKAINGKIIMPGEEFSYNETVGKRTKEKGYGEAGAYLNGEVVNEIGGGVCQVSTTTYNAIFRAGFRSTERTSHTFAPSYVTPGLDATVSWGGPDYKFVNDSPYPIGLRAHYASRKVTVSVFGVPVLPEGVTLDLVSHKTATLGVPAPVYIISGKAENGSAGSIWEAYKVTYKDGEEISRDFDHTSKYVGHTPRILVNPLLPEGMTQEEYDALIQSMLQAQNQNQNPENQDNPQ